jgi:hypothetical protein
VASSQNPTGVAQEQALRVYLEKELGLQDFLSVYHYLEDNGDGPSVLYAYLASSVGSS